MTDDWDRFVRVIRADGSERTLPLVAWTEDLEKRALEAGCRIVMPEDKPPAAKPPPPKNNRPGQSDRDLVQALLDIEAGLTDWEVEFSESLSRWLDSHDTLTNKQRAKAEQILAEVGEKR